MRSATVEAETISRASGAGFGQVEDDGSQARVSLAGGDRKVPGRPAQVDQAAKPAQIERGDDVRRADEAIPVHGHQELSHRFFGPKEVREDRAVPAEGLLPAIGSLADRILQVAPHLPENRIRVVDVTGQARRALLAQVALAAAVFS